MSEPKKTVEDLLAEMLNEMRAARTCTPVWQYLLIMGREIEALALGIRDIGGYHSSEDLQEFARYVDLMIVELRERVEKLTGWENHSGDA